MDKLREKSLLALEKQRTQSRRSLGLSPKTFQGVDADQGQLTLRGSQGGTANTSSQQVLSNAAIQKGKAVSSYNWETADWKPTLSAIGGEDISRDDNRDSFESQERSNNPDDVPDDTPAMNDANDGDGDGNGYCSCQTLWIRGTPDRSEPENEPLPFQGGQCDDTLYRVSARGSAVVPPSGPYQVSFPTLGPIGGVQENHSQDPETGRWSGQAWIEARNAPNGRLQFPPLVGTNPVEQIAGYSAFEERQTIFVDILDPVVAGGAGNNDCLPPAETALPETGPPGNTDPGEWRGYTSCNLPLGYETNDLGSKLQVVISDATGRIAVLGYAKDEKLDVSIRCKEDGPP